MTTTLYVRKRRADRTTPEGTLPEPTWHILRDEAASKDTGCRTRSDLADYVAITLELPNAKIVSA